MKIKTRWEIAHREAADVIERLTQHCVRIQSAGSLRRLAPEVGDIEIVAIPKPITDMFGEEAPLTSDHALNYVDWTRFGKLIANGNKLKKVQLECGIQLDLFIVTPPAQWGVLFLIRTGPAEYSHRFVTHKGMGGMMPGHLRVKDGAIWDGDTLLQTPEENDVYQLIGLPYMEPNNRV